MRYCLTPSILLMARQPRQLQRSQGCWSTCAHQGSNALQFQNSVRVRVLTSELLSVVHAPDLIALPCSFFGNGGSMLHDSVSLLLDETRAQSAISRCRLAFSILAVLLRLTATTSENIRPKRWSRLQDLALRSYSGCDRRLRLIRQYELPDAQSAALSTLEEPTTNQQFRTSARGKTTSSALVPAMSGYGILRRSGSEQPGRWRRRPLAHRDMTMVQRNGSVCQQQFRLQRVFL
jgi:hypothetical protein